MNRRKNDFNYSRLCEIVSRLNTRLLEIVKRDRKGLISDKEIVLVEKNEEMEDCYNSLSFQYIREVKRGGYFSRESRRSSQWKTFSFFHFHT